MEIGFILNLDKICRVCLIESSEMRSIFNSKNNLSDMLTYSCGIKISKDDGLPSQLCVDCTELVQNASMLKKRCMKADIDLRKYIENNSKNEESLRIKKLMDHFALSPDHIELGIVRSSSWPEVGSLKIATETYTSTDNLINENTNNIDCKTKSPLQIVESILFKYLSENDNNCSICTQEFNSVYKRKKHQFMVHKVCKKEYRNDGKSYFICPFCDEVFSKHSLVRQHTNYHVESEEEQLFCGICKCYFNSYLQINRHKERIHQSIKLNPTGQIELDIVENNAKEYDNRISIMEDEQNVQGKLGEGRIEDKVTSEYTEENVSLIADTNREENEGEEMKFLEIVKTKNDTSHFSDLPDSSDIPDYVSDVWDPSIQNNHSDDMSINLLKSDLPQLNRCNNNSEIELKKKVKKSKTKKNVKDFVLEENMKKKTGKGERKNNKQDINCDYCKRTFRSKKMLENHFRTKHNGVGADDVTKQSHEKNKKETVDMSTGPKQPTLCLKCGKEFKRQSHLTRHMLIHQKKKQSYPCTLCIRTFKFSNHLQMHIRSHRDKHGQPIIIQSETQKDKKIICTVCGKSSSCRSNHAVHMRRHTGTATCHCKVCGKGFPRSTDLTLHMRRHTGEKPYICTLCQKGFVRSDKLVIHMRSHTGERPYVCHKCGRAFKQSSDLKSHERRIQCHSAARSDPDKRSSSKDVKKPTINTRPNNIVAIEGMTNASNSKISEIVKQNLFVPYILAGQPIKFDLTDYSNSLIQSQFSTK